MYPSVLSIAGATSALCHTPYSTSARSCVCMAGFLCMSLLAHLLHLCCSGLSQKLFAKLPHSLEMLGSYHLQGQPSTTRGRESAGKCSGWASLEGWFCAFHRVTQSPAGWHPRWPSSWCSCPSPSLWLPWVTSYAICLCTWEIQLSISTLYQWSRCEYWWHYLLDLHENTTQTLCFILGFIVTSAFTQVEQQIPQKNHDPNKIEYLEKYSRHKIKEEKL